MTESDEQVRNHEDGNQVLMKMPALRQHQRHGLSMVPRPASRTAQ